MLIFIDIETTGLDRVRDNMVSLGAVTEDGKNQFYLECRLEPGDSCSQEALAINGFTADQLWDKEKPTREQVYHDFVRWVRDIEKAYGEPITLAGENIASFDAIFLRKAFDGKLSFGKDWPFGHRFFDTHTIAQFFLHKSQSLDKSLQALGLDPETKPHNALNGAKAAQRLYAELRKENL